ncbi:phosphate-starvation-inducible PsiE family protein [Methylococcaceae bacterium WWC4]|uniref:phosphate-starvation-inducible PsiE family protein n=1 Tax=Methylomonas sp. CM2 TaxID=3417647 RepID=UPI00143B417C|nr:phosphate-starvation-inducible PsiE family protein [Methylococcaceae bacterium WWC4]
MDKPPVRPSAPAPASAPRPSGGRNSRDSDGEVKLPPPVEDAMIKILHAVIHFAVRILAVLMVLVILWGVADVAYVMFQKLVEAPFMMLTVSDILVIFGSFMAVLIAIEIFVNITVYIKHDALPIKMVIATALMAVARKVIMLDFKELEWHYIVAIATVILALGLTYWLISPKPQPVKTDDR